MLELDLAPIAGPFLGEDSAVGRFLGAALGSRTLDQNAYRNFIAWPLFAAQERLKGHETLRRLRELEQSQWLDLAAVQALQAEQLRPYLERVGRNVPYYRELFRRLGFDPATVRGPGDLARLPLLSKTEIRADMGAFVAEGARRLLRYQTGGSTGEPLQFFVGPARVSSDVATRCRAMRWWGVEVGDPEVALWASPIEVTRQDRLRALRDWVLRSRLLSADKMTPGAMDHYLDIIEKARPVQIFSHGSALAELARHAEERRRSLTGIGIRVAFVTSEQLYDFQRERIERVFGCRVANGYGARDAGFVAHECPEGGMHLSAEDIIVEIVDDRGVPLPPGRPGEITVTHLRSFDFPFIRYRTGDVGVLHDAPCSCGRGLPLIREIHGRADDILLGLDGSRVPGQAVVYLLRGKANVRAFRILQETRDTVKILLVKSGEFAPGAEAEIVKGARFLLGDGMQIQFVAVPDIPLDASGKYRTVVSRVGISPMAEGKLEPSGEAS